jgi:hypothetical protein
MFGFHVRHEEAPMMTLRARILSMALIAGLIAACGSDDDDRHHGGDDDGLVTHPLGTATSTEGHFIVTIAHDPITPTTGQNSLVLTLDSTTHAVDGLSVSVVPWMPGHGHGSNATPWVSDDGAGVYRVTNVVYTMPGLWQARVTLEGDGVEDAIVFEFQVQ